MVESFIVWPLSNRIKDILYSVATILVAEPRMVKPFFNSKKIYLYERTQVGLICFLGGKIKAPILYSVGGLTNA